MSLNNKKSKVDPVDPGSYVERQITIKLGDGCRLDSIGAGGKVPYVLTASQVTGAESVDEITLSVTVKAISKESMDVISGIVGEDLTDIALDKLYDLSILQMLRERTDRAR
jgi:hypothetical protein